MIRRGFWLAVGATGGIMGYRRVSSLGRQLSATLSPAAPRDGAEKSAGGKRPSGKARRGLARGTIRFTRDVRMFTMDVREGMDLYSARHPGRSRRSLMPPFIEAWFGMRHREALALVQLAAPTSAALHRDTDHDKNVKDDR